MIQIIISIDPSTQFLFEIVKKLKHYDTNCNVYEIYPNNESYSKTFDIISNLERNSRILFLGHGQSNQLYGGECLDSFPKKAFVKLNEMNIFKDQHLFLLACDSADLIKSSFRHSKMSKSIGFGGLPTSMEEVEKDKKLSSEGISEETIEDFKNEIVCTVSKAISLHYQDFNQLSDYLTLLLDQRINNAVLVKKNRNLADLLFKMRNEMVIY
nr:hypothetical protein [uncultured Flavobacterium sp.]